MSGPDPIEVALIVVKQLDRLGIPYLVGGSLASMLFGETRSTRDIDIVADMEPRHVDAFVAALGDAFYADATAIREAIERRDHFNLLHLASVYKVDVFVPPRQGLHRQKWSRRRRLALKASGEEAWITSPEDIVLQKLDWFRSGDCVSDQQWRDVLGVIKVQAEALDRAYLREWAGRMGLSELLERALEEGGLRSSGGAP